MMENKQKSSADLLFSFEWMTKNSKYNQKAFEKMKGSAARPETDLLCFLIELSKKNWSDLDSLSKYDGGYEVLPPEEMKEVILDNLPESEKDGLEGLIVFRFNEQKDRLIVLKKENILYVLGFDLDHSLYNHGS